MSYAGRTREELLHERAELLRKRETLNQWSDLKATRHGDFLKGELEKMREHARTAYAHIPSGKDIAPILLAKLQEREKVLLELLAVMEDTDKTRKQLDQDGKEIQHWLTVKDDEPSVARRQSIHQGEENGRDR